MNYKEMAEAIDRFPMPESVTVTVRLAGGREESRSTMFGPGFNEAARRIPSESNGMAESIVQHEAAKNAKLIIRQLALEFSGG